MKKIFVSAVIFLLMSRSLFAMGLGKITVHSYLDQPFDADIELIDVGHFPLSEIKANLASADDYERMGLERAYEVSLLSFHIEKDAKAKIIVKVRSTERITEPYMQLLVELAWASGQIDRAYPVLLDPPHYQLNQVKKQLHTLVRRVEASQSASLTKEPSIEEKSHTLMPKHHGVAMYGPTASSETIWQIAQHYKTEPILLQQIILAMVGMNPQAFTEGNLNGLKVGSLLKVPSMSTASQVPEALAKTEVLAHDKAWQSRQPIEHTLLPPYIDSDAAPIVTNTDVGVSKIPSIPVLSKQMHATPETGSRLLPLSTSLLFLGDTEKTPPHSSAEASALVGPDSLQGIRAQLESLRKENAALKQQLQWYKQHTKAGAQKTKTAMAPSNNVTKQSQTQPGSSFWFWVIGFIGIGLAGWLMNRWYFMNLRRTLTTKPKPESPVLEEVKSQLIREEAPPPVQTKEEVIPPAITPDEFKITSEAEPVASEEKSAVIAFEEEKPDLKPSMLEKEIPLELDLEKTSELQEDISLEFETDSKPTVNDELSLNVEPIKEAPAKITSEKEAAVELEKDDHCIEFVLNPVDSNNTSSNPMKSTAALETLLELAKTYISIGDVAAAKDSLQEVIEFGSEQQQLEARQLLDKMNPKE